MAAVGEDEFGGILFLSLLFYVPYGRATATRGVVTDCPAIFSSDEFSKLDAFASFAALPNVSTQILHFLVFQQEAAT